MNTIAKLLEHLDAVTDGPWIADAEVRARVLDALGEEQGEVALLSAAHETDDEQKAVDDWVRRWFGLGLPGDYATFAARRNGLAVELYPAREADIAPDDDAFEANALLPLSELDCLWSMRTVTVDVPGSDTTAVEHRHPKVIPFYALSETVFHAFDYGRVDQDGNVPVVAVDAGGSRLDVSQRVLAGSFTDWLRVWIEGGFEARR